MEWTGLLQVIQKDLEIQEIYQRFDFLSPESLGFVVGITSLGICTKKRFYGTHFSYHLDMLPFPFQDGDIQKKVHITAQKFFEMSRLFFCHRPINSLNVLPPGANSYKKCLQKECGGERT